MSRTPAARMSFVARAWTDDLRQELDTHLALIEDEGHAGLERGAGPGTRAVQIVQFDRRTRRVRP